MDETNFEPTSIVTRREYNRKKLGEQFAKSLESKLKPAVISDEKNLQGTKIIFVQCDCKQKDSIWTANAHQTRRFRRSSEFTKPDCAYLGTSQWR